MHTKSIQKMKNHKFASIALFSGILINLMIVILVYSIGISITKNIEIGLRWLGLLSILYYGYVQSSLTVWIFISMLIGLALGADFPEFSTELNVIAKVFLKLIKTVIAPLLFGTLVVGIAGHSDIKQVGRMGWKSLLYFTAATSLALVIGLIAINISQAGVGIHQNEKPNHIYVEHSHLSFKVDTVAKEYTLMYNHHPLKEAKPKPKQTAEEVILHIFPENISKMIYEGQVLQVVVFSILFAMGLMMVSEPHKTRMLHFAEDLTEVMFKFTHLIMYLAPFAVAAAIAHTIGKMGFGILLNLGILLITLYLALIAFVLLVLTPIMFILKIPIIKFWKAVLDPASLAFATASSEAALPKAMTAMEAFGVPRKIVSFVIPTGYSFNLDGTTLYLSLATIFVAQAAGMDFTWGQQLLIMATLLLMSKGVAGVPRASLVILSGAASMYDLPEWPIAVILGIDALMDMARTAVNLIGNCLASVVIAKWEGEFQEN